MGPIGGSRCPSQPTGAPGPLGAGTRPAPGVMWTHGTGFGREEGHHLQRV